LIGYLFSLHLGQKQVEEEQYMAFHKGRVFKYRDNVNTDEIIPARYLNTNDPYELAKHCMEDIDKNFVKKVKAGDFIVAGRNFGSGSSREHAPISIKYAGISAVIAKSFSRIFFRNAINIGLRIIESEEIVDAINDGDEIEADFEKGIVMINGKEYSIPPFPKEVEEIIKAGGLVEKLKEEVNV
jgi:3-isopropylmalate/(R)-2-methylmalate dehydratase small subunit